MRTGTEKGESVTSREGSGGRGEKMSPLVVDVLEYWAAYRVDGAN